MNTLAALLFGITAVCVSAGVAPPIPDESVLTVFATPDPAGYFEAAERLAGHDETRRLGEETFAMVVLLAAENDPVLAAGACVALASLSSDAAARTGLWSLAVELDPARANDRRWLVSEAEGLASVDARASRVLGMLRDNNPEAVGQLNDDPAIRTRIVAEAVRLGHEPSRVSAVLAKWERDTNDDPCGGRLTVRVRQGGSIVVSPCPSPSFHHGARIDADWAMMIGVEMSLLGATPDSWPAQAAVGLDAAVPVWTVEGVGRAYGVSADRPLRRSGRWAAP